MKYIYHYHIIRPLKDGSVNHSSGVFERFKPIDNTDEYQSSIKFLCDHLGIPLKECIVASMSLLSNPQA